jgi:hypothetical protein
MQRLYVESIRAEVSSRNAVYAIAKGFKIKVFSKQGPEVLVEQQILRFDSKSEFP